MAYETRDVLPHNFWLPRIFMLSDVIDIREMLEKLAN